jgi:hypothetical protein
MANVFRELKMASSGKVPISISLTFFRKNYELTDGLALLSSFYKEANNVYLNFPMLTLLHHLYDLVNDVLSEKTCLVQNSITSRISE